MQLLAKGRRFLRCKFAATSRAELLWLNAAANSEQIFANYGEHPVQPGLLVFYRKENYEDTYNLASVPGDGGISEPL
jgi:hypothetical protein